MAHRKGSVNYKNKVLIKLISKILPNCEYGWQAVAMAYQEKTKEEALHDCSDVKKHLIKNLCNNMKKPTGMTGEDGNWINRCMAIEKKSMMKTHLGLFGFTSEEEGSVNSERETENTGRGGSEGCLTKLAFDLEYNDEGNPNATPAPVNITSIPPLRCPPRISPIRQKETNVDSEGMAPAPATDATRNAPRKAESSIKAQKMKNLLNKQKERTYIAGAIVKLIEQGQHHGRNNEHDVDAPDGAH
jgi:hypothetical protein